MSVDEQRGVRPESTQTSTWVYCVLMCDLESPGTYKMTGISCIDIYRNDLTHELPNTRQYIYILYQTIVT